MQTLSEIEIGKRRKEIMNGERKCTIEVAIERKKKVVVCELWHTRDIYVSHIMNHVCSLDS